MSHTRDFIYSIWLGLCSVWISLWSFCLEFAYSPCVRVSIFPGTPASHSLDMQIGLRLIRDSEFAWMVVCLNLWYTSDLSRAYPASRPNVSLPSEDKDNGWTVSYLAASAIVWRLSVAPGEFPSKSRADFLPHFMTFGQRKLETTLVSIHCHCANIRSWLGKINHWWFQFSSWVLSNHYRKRGRKQGDIIKIAPNLKEERQCWEHDGD